MEKISEDDVNLFFENEMGKLVTNLSLEMLHFNIVICVNEGY